MLKFCTFPAIDNIDQLSDIVSRISWHFSHVDDIKVTVLVTEVKLIHSDIKVPSGFDPDVQGDVNLYKNKIDFVLAESSEESINIASNFDIILKHIEGADWVDTAIKKLNKKIYRVDPAGVRQEGSFYIQAAFDAIENKQEFIDESMIKFNNLKARIGKNQVAWVLATGPSIENYKKQNFSDSVVIACNSTVLNADLMKHAKPDILVFADPIFHFGVSQYAGKFREIVSHTLETTDISIVLPIKYYPLFISKFPEKKHRIIGVPFEPSINFNLDLGSSFKVKTTSNILTLLLLPLATTFAGEVRMLGCDGRPLDENAYFWGHGKSVQINDKMENIKKVHPGFFDIDYNEYYFEHCHTLENLIKQGESQDICFFHYGNSHIPALRDRHQGKQRQLGKPFKECFIIVEPDGIGLGGHYVHWHNQLINATAGRFKSVYLLCNKKQDPSLYNCKSLQTFTSHSWGVSRSPFSYNKDFSEHDSIKRFHEELFESLLSISSKNKIKNHVIFMYYGSTQFLKIFHAIKKLLREKNIDIKINICLFHESVLLDNNIKSPRFPPGTKEILLEGAAQIDSYRLFSVTPQLSEHIYRNFGVNTRILPNPPPSLGDDKKIKIDELSATEASEHVKLNGPTVLFPCSLRPEKGGDITKQFLEMLQSNGLQQNAKYVIRGNIDSIDNFDKNITFIKDNIDDTEYWSNLINSDIIVIPYLVPNFTYRTSGIIVDALCAGKPCIVLDGTWLGDTIKKLRAGLVVKYYSPFSILSAISVITKNYSFFYENANKGFAAYLSTNSWSALTEDLLN